MNCISKIVVVLIASAMVVTGSMAVQRGVSSKKSTTVREPQPWTQKSAMKKTGEAQKSEEELKKTIGKVSDANTRAALSAINAFYSAEIAQIQVTLKAITDKVRVVKVKKVTTRKGAVAAKKTTKKVAKKVTTVKKQATPAASVKPSSTVVQKTVLPEAKPLPVEEIVTLEEATSPEGSELVTEEGDVLFVEEVPEE